MSKPFPTRPNLDHFRKEAKSTLKAHKSGDRSVSSIFRHLKRFEGSADEDILSADVALREVQQALAVEYGFRDWQSLKSHVESVATAAAEETGVVTETRSDMDAKADRRELQCSFCGKTQSEVWMLIAGPYVYICDACVYLCHDILVKDKDGESKEGKTEPAVWVNGSRPERRAAAPARDMEKRVERMKIDINRAIDHVLHAMKTQP